MAGETAAAGIIPRPAHMRNLHQSWIKKHLVIAMGCVVVVGIIGKFTYTDPKKRDYAEFYKTYDDDKVFKRMRDAGLLQSCPK